MSYYMDVLLADQRRLERRQMTAAQIAYNNQAEPEVDEDLLTEAHALTLAMEQLQTTPSVVAAWLNEECAAFTADMLGDIFRLSRRAETFDRGLNGAQLLVVLMAGGGIAANRALTMLRDLFEKDHGGAAQEFANELLADQAMRIQRERDEAADARYQATRDLTPAGVRGWRAPA